MKNHNWVTKASHLAIYNLQLWSYCNFVHSNNCFDLVNSPEELRVWGKRGIKKLLFSPLKLLFHSPRIPLIRDYMYNTRFRKSSIHSLLRVFVSWVINEHCLMPSFDSRKAHLYPIQSYINKYVNFCRLNFDVILRYDWRTVFKHNHSACYQNEE